MEEHENLVYFKVKFRGKKYKERIKNNGGFSNAPTYFGQGFSHAQWENSRYSVTNLKTEEVQ